MPYLNSTFRDAGATARGDRRDREDDLEPLLVLHDVAPPIVFLSPHTQKTDTRLRFVAPKEKLIASRGSLVH